MAQTVTQILLSQRTFSNTPPPVTGIGSIAGNILTLTADSPDFPIGAGIRCVSSTGTLIPAGTVITGLGPIVPQAKTYTLNTAPSIPISQTTITTIQGVVTSYNVTGNRVPAASYYLGNKSLQTLNIKTNQFTGTLIIEASVSTDPSASTAEPSDWFTVHTIIANAQDISGSVAGLASNTNTSINVHGNYVWMRARIVDFAAGTVNWVKLSY